MARKNKEKQVRVQVIERVDPLTQEVSEPYQIMDQVIREHHLARLVEAKIVLAWNAGWRPDADGCLTLAQCRKASDLDRELHTYDFVIMLNRRAWNDPAFARSQKVALLDHELCHASVVMDPETGEEKRDEKGRPMFRIRKHDVEEFKEIVGRHGLWRSDVEAFFRVCAQRAKAPVKAEA